MKNLIYIGAAVIVFILVFFFGWWMKPQRIVVQNTGDSLMATHAIDSMVYEQKVFDLEIKIEELKEKNKQKDLTLAKIKRDLEAERDRIRLLPAIGTVELFSLSTGFPSKLTMIDNDTAVLSPVEGIREANVIALERKTIQDENDVLNEKIGNLRDIVDFQYESLKTCHGRVGKLTQEYYVSQGVVQRQITYTEKSQKKIRNRNVVIGILSGIAAGSCAAAVLLAQ